MEKIKKQFYDDELDYLGAVDALKAIGYESADAEDLVEEWEDWKKELDS